MSGVSKKLMGTTAAGGGFTAIEDVFSTYLYTGNGSTQTITNGIDLAGEGGMLWIKQRNGTNIHSLRNTITGTNDYLSSNTANGTYTLGLSGYDVTSYNADGFSLGISGHDNVNTSGSTYASWTFRKAPRFFDVVTYTGTGSARTIDHNLGTTVGSIIIKRTDTTSNWAVYHRGNTAAPETDFLSLNLTNATADDATYWNDTAPTDSVFTVGTNAAVNASGGTYVAYLYAHDPLGPSGDGSDGLIACGSAPNNARTELGWEPQWILFKASAAATNWYIVDNMRGLTANLGDDRQLWANSSAAETAPSGFIKIDSTGFTLANISASPFIYIAIRRGPMRVPESGTEVFNTSFYGSGADSKPPAFRSTFAVDTALQLLRNGANAVYPFMLSRLTGTGYLTTSSTNPEGNSSTNTFDYNNGYNSAAPSSEEPILLAHMFRRAPEFFDVVAYTGDGTTVQAVSHNLGVAPEMMIVKSRSNDSGWRVYHSAGGNDKALSLENAGAIGVSSLYWNNTSPTESDFSVGSSSNVSPRTYIAYLFATLAGVSKVGSYVGTGAAFNVDCGFTTGARFVLIKKTSNTGDWGVFDTARGITESSSPLLRLNSTLAEADFDYLDPYSGGFAHSGANATFNISGENYIFYAVA